MKITKHICFFYLPERIKYVNRIIDETNQYECPTDLFIHTNKTGLEADTFHAYTNGGLQIVVHDLSNIHPFYLSWKCRALMQAQQNDYDVFMYVEDDILVPCKAMRYWFENNEKLIEANYNLGFVRIEVENEVEYTNDLCVTLDERVTLDDQTYAINDKNPYCAMWVYNKNEFRKFVQSRYYDIANIGGYNIREMSAVGLHGVETPWYKKTLIPIVDGKLTDACKIYHMPNNYIANKSSPCVLKKFDELLL